MKNITRKRKCISSTGLYLLKKKISVLVNSHSSNPCHSRVNSKGKQKSKRHLITIGDEFDGKNYIQIRKLQVI